MELRNILYDGQSMPLAERVELRAGPLQLIYEQGDLRSVRLGAVEILRRVYAAVRDRNWGTVPGQLWNQEIQSGTDDFRVTYAVENRQNEIAFDWRGSIQGGADGQISFEMEGTARSTFLRNRIGFCVLLPAGLAGHASRVEHGDGTREEGRLPLYISPDQPVQPFSDLRTLAYEVEPGLWAELHFEGEAFEMEDQRNWTDASFKIYGTPLALPFPVEVKAGAIVRQQVRLTVRDERSGTAASAVKTTGSTVRLTLEDAAEGCALPEVGVSAAGDGTELSERETARLRKLHLHHLRVELALADPAYPARLAQAARQAQALGVGLEAALLVSAERPEQPAQQLAALRQVLAEVRPRVATWLALPAREYYQGGAPTPEVVRAAREALRDYGDIPFATGTNSDFIFLARTRQPLEWVDRLSFALNPQVHAFDNASLVETLEGQTIAVERARQLGAGLPVMVSPITFKQRFNPYATGAGPAAPPERLPPQVDPRQMSLFGAGWTLGSLRAMVAARAASVTYYETVGWRGVMEREAGSRLPALFASIAGGVFPLYHVLADFGAFAGGRGLALRSSHPLAVSGLALTDGRQWRILAANHTCEEQLIDLPGAAGGWRGRVLDETNVEAAMRNPEGFRVQVGQRLSQPQNVVRPYGLACLDGERLG